MITFVIFVLYTLHAPWWIYVLSIIGALSELDSSNLAHRGDKIIGTRSDLHLVKGDEK